VVIDNLSSGKLCNLEAVKDKIRFIKGDITQDGLDKVSGNFDGVVHLAALISGYDSLNNPDAYVEHNITGLLKLIEFAAGHRIQRIVFASSSTVYGNSTVNDLSENNVPAPISAYAATKLFGEHLLSMYGRVHGFSHCSLRFFNVYGPRQAEDHPYANVTCKFSHAAANGIPIRLYGTGCQSRDFVYIDDVVKSILLVLDSSKSSLYNVGTGVQTSINQLIDYLEGISGRPLLVDRQDEWPNDILRISADTSRARDELGYEPTVSVSAGLAKTVSFFQHR
jgi:UDP-glucose 4-epimerase